MMLTLLLMMMIVVVVMMMMMIMMLLMMMIMMKMVMLHYNQILVTKATFPVKERTLFKTQHRGIKTTKRYLPV